MCTAISVGGYYRLPITSGTRRQTVKKKLISFLSRSAKPVDRREAAA